MKKLLTIFFLLSITVLYSKTNDVKIDSLRHELAILNTGFAETKIFEAKLLDELISGINSLTENGQIKKNESVKLLEFAVELNRLSKENITPDSLQKHIRAFNNYFNVVFGEYFHNKLLKSDGLKIVMVFASLSCECTLEMTYKQELLIQKYALIKENNLEYAVVDAFTNPDIQEKYDAGFTPTVVILDPQNNIIKKLVRDEHFETGFASGISKK